MIKPLLISSKAMLVSLCFHDPARSVAPAQLPFGLREREKPETYGKWISAFADRCTLGNVVVDVFIRMLGIVRFEQTNRRHKEEDATRRSRCREWF